MTDILRPGSVVTIQLQGHDKVGPRMIEWTVPWTATSITVSDPHPPAPFEVGDYVQTKDSAMDYLGAKLHAGRVAEIEYVERGNRWTFKFEGSLTPWRAEFFERVIEPAVGEPWLHDGQWWFRVNSFERGWVGYLPGKRNATWRLFSELLPGKPAVAG